MGNELALKRIFEAGLFYNAALRLYRDDIKLIDEFMDQYEHCEKEIRVRIGDLLFIYFIEREPQQEMLLFQAMQVFSSGADVVLAAKDLKTKVVLPWSPFYLLKTEREILRPEILLDEFLTLVSRKRGFKSIMEEDVNLVEEKFSLLKYFRKENQFFKDRVKIKRNAGDGNIHIFYNTERVTFRNSLVYAMENINHELGCDLLAEKWSAKNMSSLGGMLLAQAYLSTRNSHGLSQEAYFNHILDKYPAMANIGLRDKKNIYDGMKNLGELPSIFKKNYEVDADELTVQRQRFSHESRNVAEIDNRIEPSVLLKSSLSLYITYYCFLLKNVGFIKLLQKLMHSIKDIVIRQFKKSEYVIFYILNVINGSLPKEQKQSFSDIIQAVETQCYGLLKNLRAYPAPQNLWGYFTSDFIVPEIDEIINSLGALYSLCNQNYQNVTYDNLKEINMHEVFKKSLLINRMIYVESEFISAAYGLSDHTIVIPVNAPENVYGTVRAALELYDKSLKNNYLLSTIIHKDLEEMQCILWGLYHLYQKEFSYEKTTNELSIDRIGQHYQQPISESKFKKGKKLAQQLIESFGRKS